MANGGQAIKETEKKWNLKLSKIRKQQRKKANGGQAKTGALADELYVDDGDPNTPDPFLGLTIDRHQDTNGRLDQVRLLDDQPSTLYQVD